MKRFLLTLLVFTLSLPYAGAVPAKPTTYRHTQPDGSVIVLKNHGDEWFHWTTDAQGRVVAMDADGFYRPTGESAQAMAAKAAQKQQESNLSMNMAKWSSYEKPPVTNFGDRKILCLIANFSDTKFTVSNPNQHFTDLLNQEGYNQYGSIGSVRDYFIDNSRGLYRPHFDVYGPVTLPHPSSYFVTNDYEKVPDGILEAYELLKDQINIDDYDTDGDGDVDMVLFYYPGYNAAEGGGSNTIWPHQYESYFGKMGDKSFVRYFCTSELQGYTGKKPASIGGTCHEFAHSLGLPDFYDTDYEYNGFNYYTTGSYDLMSDGSYNEDSARPPYLSAVERNMLGWMDYPETFMSSGMYSLPAVQENRAFQFATTVDGEYYVVEARNGEKWDAGLPEGMLLYHVDKSSRKVGSYYTARSLWNNTNSINAYGGHPCFCLEPRTSNSDNRRIFPGADGITSYTPLDWNGTQAGPLFNAITVTPEGCSFSLTMQDEHFVYGLVTDTAGKPVEGAQVSLTPSVEPFADAAPATLSGTVTCLTDKTGAFSLTLPADAPADQILSARLEGYVPVCFDLTLTAPNTKQNITLLLQGEGPSSDLSKYDASLTLSKLNYTGSAAVGMYYTADELAAKDLVGTRLKCVSFLSAALAVEGETVWVVVEIGGERVLCKDITSHYVPDSWNTIDISGEDIIIPSGKDLIVGYGLTSIKTYYPFYTYCYASTSSGACYANQGFPDGGKWAIAKKSRDKYYQFPVSATLSRTEDVTFSTLGVSFIEIVGGRPTVSVAAGKSLRSTTWYLDGNVVGTPPKTGSLSAGSHTYMVRLSFYDGTVERVYYDVDVE